jgi:lipopolysaccharide export system permease protein
MGDYFLPRGTVRFGNLYREILYANPAIELEANSVNRYRDTIIVTGDTEGGSLQDLVIFDRSDEGGSRVILASEAELSENPSTGGVLTLGLSDVFGHTVAPQRRGSFDYFSSRRMEYNILLRDISFSVDNLSPREMSTAAVYRGIVERRRELAEREAAHRRELLQRRGELRALYYGEVGAGGEPFPEEEARSLLQRIEELEGREFTSSTLQMYRLEFHKKIAIPFGCIAFIVFAFPFGSFTGRGGRSVGFGIGLLVSVIYWAMLFAGQTLGTRFDVSPLLAMWAPNAVLMLIGLVTYRVRFRL